MEFLAPLFLFLTFMTCMWILFIISDFIGTGFGGKPSYGSAAFTHKFFFNRLSVIVKEERVNDEIKYRVYRKCWKFPPCALFDKYTDVDIAKMQAANALSDERRIYDERFNKKINTVFTLEESKH